MSKWNMEESWLSEKKTIFSNERVSAMLGASKQVWSASKMPSAPRVAFAYFPLWGKQTSMRGEKVAKSSKRGQRFPSSQTSNSWILAPHTGLFHCNVSLEQANKCSPYVVFAHFPLKVHYNNKDFQNFRRPMPYLSRIVSCNVDVQCTMSA